MLEAGFYCMDCMDSMKKFPDKFFELAIVDPPYGIYASNPSKKPAVVMQKNGKFLRTKTNEYTKKSWDNKPAGSEYFDELFRISNNQIIWGANYYNFEMGIGRIVWDKLNGQSDQMGCEIAYNSFNNRTDIVRFMWSGMFQGVYCGLNLQQAMIQQGNKSLNEKRIHPTQKPIALYKWLLTNYAHKGDKILDTHVGSASSLIACHQLGFQYWGFELDHDYYIAASERLAKAKAQVSIFETIEPQAEQLTL